MADHPPAAPPATPPPPTPPEGWPPLAPVVTPPAPGLVGRIATVLAGLGLLGYLVAAVLLAVPVETPQVQDCGAPGAYLLAGRVDRVPTADDRILDEAGEIVTLDADVAAEARATPCRERVAERAVPAAVSILAATVIGLAAFVLELFVVRPRQRRAVRAAMGPHAPAWGVPPGPSGG